MRILFYVEPFLDKSFVFCNFFENYFKGLIVPWLLNLEKFVNKNNLECEINIICSEVCKDFADNKAIKSKIIFLNNKVLCDIFGSYQNYIFLKKNIPTSEKLEKLSKIILKEIGNKEPDILIGCSNNMGFIGNFFKKTTILYNESGLFGYVGDFEHTLYFDIIENGKSYLNHSVIDELSISFNENELNNYKAFIKKIKEFFVKESRKVDIYKIIDVNKYKKIGLFALQRWDSELMQMSTDFINELDYIINVLESVSCDFGIIITLHKSSSIVANNHIESYLYKKFPNIKIIKDQIDAPSISILNYCDFVITNSSTTALYAPFLDKKLFVTSDKSWLKNLSNSFNVEDFNYNTVNSDKKDLEKIKKFLISCFFVPSKLFLSGEFFYNFLKRINDNKINNFKSCPYQKNDLKQIFAIHNNSGKIIKNKNYNNIFKKIKLGYKSFFDSIKKFYQSKYE